MTDSVYIHIPFCKSKCKYCSFVSFVNEEKIQSYVEALLKEIDKYYRGESLKTLYFGGGTPSLLLAKELKKIIDKFQINHNCEVTLEMNPDDANEDYLKSLNSIGINRLSIGAQTFDNEVLKFIGRRHNFEQTIKTVQLAKDVGFKNISLDLIYGLPNANIESDLEKILQLNVQHISTYGLKIEEGSYFYKHYPENLPDEDMQADMYIKINEILNNAGFERYEISNFAQKGYESKHNLNYWNNEEYYGFGVAAHGYVDSIRYSNPNTLEKYLSAPFKHECEHIVTQQEKLEEEIFLGFRKSTGINTEKINKNFDLDFDQKYKKILNKYVPNYIAKTDKGYKLTLQGVLLSNNILAEFLDL